MPIHQIPRLIGGLGSRRGLIALWCFVAVACAQVTNAPTKDAITTAGPVTTASPPPAGDVAMHESPPFTPVVEVSDSTETSIAEPPTAIEPEPPPPSVLPGDIALEVPEPAVVEPAAPAAQDYQSAAGLIPSSVVSLTSAETLDFSSLVTRLRKTKAINLRTKVAVKNESDDLLEQFRAYHTQHGVVALADLRRSYESLFHKLHSLLEDADPPLARDIDRSRAAIWELLADPTKFSASVMSGA